MSKIKNNEITHSGNSGTSNIILGSSGEVTPSKLKFGSDAAGDIAYYNGTGYTRLAPAGASKTLKMNSSNNAPEWVTVAAAAQPGWNKIATTTYSDVATIDIENTAAFDGTYDFVKIYLSNVRPASDSQMLLWRIKQSGSYVTSSDYFSHSLVWYNNTDTITNERAGSEARGEWTTGTIGNAAADSFHGHMEFATPTNTSYYPSFSWEGWGVSANNTSMKVSGSGYCDAATAAFTGIRLYAVSGNLSAKVTVYGLLT